LKNLAERKMEKEYYRRMQAKTLSSTLGFRCESPDQIRERVLANGLSLVELNMIDISDLSEIKQMIVDHDLTVGVHSPLIMHAWYPFTPTASFLLGDAGEDLKELTLRFVSQTLEDSRDLGAAYVVAHFPKPAPADHQQPDWTPQMEVAWDSAARLAQLAEKYQIRVNIEGFGERPFLSTDFLTRVLTTFPALSYCFDVGHIHLAALHGVLDYFDFLRRLAPYIGSVHLWNTRGPQDYAEYSHLPTHPSQQPASGWANIPRTVRIIREINPDAIFIFEHSTQFPSPFELDYREGVDWIRQVLDLVSAEPRTSI
jgi:sugar phosphate isomerase/epimerase